MGDVAEQFLSVPERRIMKALITGHSGFIGSHLCQLLITLDYEVVRFERKWFTEKNLEQRLKKIKPDFIFHLSAYGNMFHQDEEEKTINANILDLCYLLHATRNINYKAFVNISTSSVTLPYQTMYSATKLSGEHLCEAFANKYHKPIVSCRPYSIYGPGEADFRFIPTVIRKIIQDEVLELDPKPCHDWVYIDDCVEALLEASKKTKQKIINIGTGISYSNLVTVKTIETILGKKAKIEIVKSLRKYDSKNWVCEKSILQNYEWPAVSFRVGLEKTVKYYLEKYAKR